MRPALADAGGIGRVTGHQHHPRLGLANGIDLRRAGAAKPPRRDHTGQRQRHEGTSNGKVATTGTPGRGKLGKNGWGLHERQIRRSGLAWGSKAR